MGAGIKWALVALLALVGYAAWQKHAARVEISALAAVTDAQGFIELDPPDGAKRNVVMIVAAQNCPRAAAQHADALARAMADRTYRFVRTSSVRFTPPPGFGDDYMTRHNDIMNREPPLVFVNGRVKSNPTLDEVIAEYEAANP
ncbi:MAG: hypothetical protein ABJB01_05520 [Rudaea sp.]